MASTIKRYFLHYLYGCFAEGWNSASLTVKGYVTLAIGNNIAPESVPHVDWHALLDMWAVSFLLFGVVNYFAKHPLPDAITESKSPTPVP
jgi:hypothetical protein